MRRSAFLFGATLGLPVLGGTLFAACSDDPAPAKEPIVPVTFESGSRLRANVFVTAEGDEIFIDFYDRELDLDCSFEETTAGYRCVPAHSLDLSLGFSDEQCTEPIAIMSQEPCVAKSSFVVARSENGSCFVGENRPISAFYRASKVNNGQAIFRGGPGGCAEDFSGFFSWRDLDQLPLEDFATAEEQVGAATEGIATRMLVSSDGAKVAIGLIDSERDERCTVFAVGPGEPGRCVPSSARVMRDRLVLVGDCESDTLGIFSDSDCGPPAELVVDRSATCVQSLDVFAAGAPTSGNGSSFLGSFECMELPLAIPGEVQVTPLEEAVDVTQFPAVRSRSTGTSRVTTRIATAEDNTPFAVPLPTNAARPQTFLFDEQLGQPCTPMQDESGTWRCVSGPLLAPQGALFSDPECTAPVVVVEPCGFGVPSIGFHANCALAPVTGAFTIGAPAPQVYVSSPPDCFAIGPQPNTFVISGQREVGEFPVLEKQRQ